MRQAYCDRYDDLNVKVNEYLYRRVDLADVVEAHMLAAERVLVIGFGRYIVSATTPFRQEHLSHLRTDAAGVVCRLFPDYEEVYSRRGWKMFSGIDRVYVNDRARQELGWKPRFDFRHVLDRLQRGEGSWEQGLPQAEFRGWSLSNRKQRVVRFS